MKSHLSLCLVAIIWGRTPLRAEVCNLKIVTDASPDYSDMASLVHSTTAKWKTPEEKCWAVFYWNHIARRQTAPMILHGTELTDPIRQFNDYGYTMCSTISGINCAIWQNMGLKPRFWDISLHTVPEVFYEGHWHMYDNSMSALYTLCDGRTLAAVQDIGQTGACDASHGESAPGHIAKYHCLYSTGPNGFLTGADTQRSLSEEAHCFNTNGLKHRYYYFNWDYGHRYILNLKTGESYTRHYNSLGKTPQFFIPNEGKDPDDRYQLRGNGVWRFHANLSSADGRNDAYSFRNVTWDAEGAHPSKTGETGEVIFKVQGANVITSQRIRALVSCREPAGRLRISTSTNNGLRWSEVWKSKSSPADHLVELKLVEQVNGAYEVLIKVQMETQGASHDVALKDFETETTTMLNAKTQPRLNLGRNTIFVGAGEQADSIVFWPELQNGKYKNDIVEEKNIACAAKNPRYLGVIHPQKAREDAYLVYRIEAPGDITQIKFGGRFYNRAPQSHIDLLYSLDGQFWTNAWSLRRTNPPWDVIHYEAAKIGAGHRSVWVKYLMNSTSASPDGCGIYALRMEANYLPQDTTFKPVQVTFHWSERQGDRSLIEQGHTVTIDRLPFKYTIDVAGADQPVMNWLRVNLRDRKADLKDGYTVHRNQEEKKFVPRRLELGRNIAQGKSYSLSKPSASNWGAGDDGKKLTSGAGGPSYAGGTSYQSGALWMENANPSITVDLGDVSSCASFGMNFHGYPWWDALKGEFQDKVEVLTSLEGSNYVSQGFLKTDLRWVDLPVNYMWTDEETMTSGTFRLLPDQPVRARFVKYQVTNKRILDCAGIEVLDSVRQEPFDLRIALPDEDGFGSSQAPADDGT